MDLPVESRPEPLGHLLSGTMTALQDLATRHVELAEVELERDREGLGVDLALLGGAAFAAGVGCLVLCLALALALGEAIGQPGGFAIVGVVNGAAAAVAGNVGLRRIKSRRLLDDT